ncbi:HAD family hydrolase [Kitasatospora sp. NPDC101176]|uniref:HAD family hydrolase n=1 Tax=Kitasatospora sp. NPDC101176 TaxID=3364099 RepID=UPI003829F31E
MGRLVLVDLDDTLIDRRSAVTAWAADFTANHRLSPEAARVVAEALRERARPETFAGLRDTLGLAESAAELWSGYVAEIASKVASSAEALVRLDLLRTAGWSVGVLTNGGSDIQRAKLAAAGVLGHVDTVCISEEIGARKPDPQAFRAALSYCGFEPPGDVWMIGDDPVSDIAGANAAGLSTIWISAGAAWSTPDVTPHHIAVTVVDAADYLLELSESA